MKVTDLEWPEDDEHHAGGKVGQGALQREADGETGGTDNSDKGGGLDAELRKSGQHHESQQGRVGQINDKFHQHLIGLRPPHGFADGPGEHPRKPFTNDEYDDGGNHLEAIGGSQGLHHFGVLIHIFHRNFPL